MQPGSPASSTRLRCLHPCNLLATLQVLRFLPRGLSCARIEKLSREGVEDPILFRNLMANTRDPDMLGLDHVLKIAANNVASDEILKVMNQLESIMSLKPLTG